MGRAVLTRPQFARSDRRRQAATLSAGRGSGVLRVWSGYALLLTVTAVPLFSTALPPLFDYPNHLARMHLLGEGGNAFYSVHWAPLPNLAQDLVVPPLARLMPLDTASKLFLVIVFGLIAGSAIWLNRVATGAWRLWPLLVFLLLYSRTFLWGFVNYLFGIGMALAGAALWLALERRHWAVRILGSSLAALACYFSHIVAFGFYALVVFGVELRPAGAELRLGDWRALARRAAIAGPQFIIPAALFLAVWEPAARASVSYAGFLRKADLLFAVFDNYNRPFDIACFALFLALLGWLAVSGRLGLAPRLGWAAGVVFAAYLLLPSQLYGGSGADHRLPIALFSLLVSASSPRFPSRRAAAALAVAMLSVLALRLAVIERVWLRADHIYAADMAGIDMLPRGAKLAVAYPASAVNFVPVPELHFAALAIVRRDAFVPTLFAAAAQQPVMPRPPYAALAAEARPQQLWDAFVGGDTAELARQPAALRHYDYVAFTDSRPVQVLPNRCLAAVFNKPRFQIFAVLHQPNCAG